MPGVRVTHHLFLGNRQLADCSQNLLQQLLLKQLPGHKIILGSSKLFAAQVSDHTLATPAKDIGTLLAHPAQQLQEGWCGTCRHAVQQRPP